MTAWLPVTIAPEYEVSEAGQIRRRGAKRLLSPTPAYGYLRVHIRLADGSRKWRSLHTIVLETFVGQRPTPRHHGAHGPDNNRANNAVGNLRWALPPENDKRACGTAPRGGRRKPTPKRTVAKILQRRASGESLGSIARAFRLHRHSVSRIVRGLRRASIAA